MGRVDFSDLAEAFREQDHNRMTRILNELTPRLRKYLYFGLGADAEVADDCIQEVYARIFEKIREQDIEDEKSLLQYLLRSCRFEYIRITNFDRRFEDISEDELSDEMSQESQRNRLLDEQRMKILEECMGLLRDRYREVISYYFSDDMDHPEDAIEEMGLTPGQFRTIKSRAVKKLHDCFKKKSGGNSH
ncbi:MAG: sigma-70 family RNA polymerase sigma factor [Balneolaceae bacterium]